MIGRVVSTKMVNTAVVLVTRTAVHPLYKKAFTRSKKFFADDQIGVKLGDIVEIEKIRPISKLKHWRVVKVVGRDIEEIVSEELKAQGSEQIAEVMPEAPEETEEVVEESVEVEKPQKKGVKKPAKKKAKTEETKA